MSCTRCYCEQCLPLNLERQKEFFKNVIVCNPVDFHKAKLVANGVLRIELIHWCKEGQFVQYDSNGNYNWMEFA